VKNLYFSRAVDNVRFAIREWPRTKWVYVNVISFLVTVALLAYLGPFGTWAFLPVSERLSFWAAAVGANWIVGYIAFSVTSRKFRVRGWSLWAGFVLAAVVAALPGTGMVWLVVTAYLDYRPSSVPDVAGLYGQVFVLHLIIGSLVFRLIDRALRRRGDPGEDSARPDGGAAVVPAVVPVVAPVVAPDAAPESALLARLPARSRGALLHLRMQDHYVEVHTVVGSTLLLMRFRDALGKVEGVDGLQVHRSHWVARSAVAGVERRGGGRIFLRLVNGNRVPVSRSFAPSLRSRGWI